MEALKKRGASAGGGSDWRGVFLVAAGEAATLRLSSLNSWAVARAEPNNPKFIMGRVADFWVTRSGASVKPRPLLADLKLTTSRRSKGALVGNVISRVAAPKKTALVGWIW